MDDKDISQMFANTLKQLEELNKNIQVLVNALSRNSDLTHQNNEIGENLKKININLGAVMAQGLSANANVQLVEKAANFFLNKLIK
ncbi:MAG: hypothetical protein V1701_02885 [Planctomycetota bacterium]